MPPPTNFCILQSFKNAREKLINTLVALETELWSKREHGSPVRHTSRVKTHRFHCSFALLDQKSTPLKKPTRHPTDVKEHIKWYPHCSMNTKVMWIIYSKKWVHVFYTHWKSITFLLLCMCRSVVSVCDCSNTSTMKRNFHFLPFLSFLSLKCSPSVLHSIRGLKLMSLTFKLVSQVQGQQQQQQQQLKTSGACSRKQVSWKPGINWSRKEETAALLTKCAVHLNFF